MVINSTTEVDLKSDSIEVEVGLPGETLRVKVGLPRETLNVTLGVVDHHQRLIAISPIA